MKKKCFLWLICFYRIEINSLLEDYGECGSIEYFFSKYSNKKRLFMAFDDWLLGAVIVELKHKNSKVG